MQISIRKLRVLLSFSKYIHTVHVFINLMRIDDYFLSLSNYRNDRKFSKSPDSMISHLTNLSFLIYFQLFLISGALIIVQQIIICMNVNNFEVNTFFPMI
jgi:hypothetical protein